MNKNSYNCRLIAIVCYGRIAYLYFNKNASTNTLKRMIITAIPKVNKKTINIIFCPLFFGSIEENFIFKMKREIANVNIITIKRTISIGI
jgi:Mg2+/citrate symporter